MPSSGEYRLVLITHGHNFTKSVGPPQNIKSVGPPLHNPFDKTSVEMTRSEIRNKDAALSERGMFESIALNHFLRTLIYEYYSNKPNPEKHCSFVSAPMTPALETAWFSTMGHSDNDSMGRITETIHLISNYLYTVNTTRRRNIDGMLGSPGLNFGSKSLFEELHAIELQRPITYAPAMQQIWSNILHQFYGRESFSVIPDISYHFMSDPSNISVLLTKLLEISNEEKSIDEGVHTVFLYVSNEMAHQMIREVCSIWNAENQPDPSKIKTIMQKVMSPGKELGINVVELGIFKIKNKQQENLDTIPQITPYLSSMNILFESIVEVPRKYPGEQLKDVIKKVLEGVPIYHLSCNDDSIKYWYEKYQVPTKKRSIPLYNFGMVSMIPINPRIYKNSCIFQIFNTHMEKDIIKNIIGFIQGGYLYKTESGYDILNYSTDENGKEWVSELISMRRYLVLVLLHFVYENVLYNIRTNIGNDSCHQLFKRYNSNYKFNNSILSDFPEVSEEILNGYLLPLTATVMATNKLIETQANSSELYNDSCNSIMNSVQQKVLSIIETKQDANGTIIRGDADVWEEFANSMYKHEEGSWDIAKWLVGVYIL